MSGSEFTNKAEIAEAEITKAISRLVPSQFYINSILDVRGTTDSASGWIKERMHATSIDKPEGETSDKILADFSSKELYDLILLQDVCEGDEISLKTLQKASRLALYALIDCSKGNYKNLASNLHSADFEVIDTTHIPVLASIIAFCRSRNYRLLKPAQEQVLLESIEAEIGQENLLSVGIFGSYTTEKQKSSSDYDLIIVAEELENIDHRESRSPKLKKLLIEHGMDGLFAFNFYTAEEYSHANESDSWLIETMKNGYRILKDREGFLDGILRRKKEGIFQISPFVWKGAKDTGIQQYSAVSARYKECEKLVREIDPDIAQYYELEKKRIDLMETLGYHNIYATRSNYFELAKLLKSQIGKDVGMLDAQKDAFEFEMNAKRAMYSYESTPIHRTISRKFAENNMLIDALRHSYQALKIAYLEILHEREVFIVDGEVTQAFLKECQSELSPQLVEKIYNFSFKAEQVLGRSHIVSFDIDKNGDPILENPNSVSLNLLIEKIDEIFDHVSNIKMELIKLTPSKKPLVSIAISTFNRQELLKELIKSINQIVFPHEKLEIVIVNDGSENAYDVNALNEMSEFPLRYIHKEHSGICDTKNRCIKECEGEFVAFVDDDVLPTPLWLLQVMSGFTKKTIAGVGSTLYTRPLDHYLSFYTDYRELERQPFIDKTGQILNLLTGNACIRKSVLEEVGGFDKFQAAGIHFGGDDVDLTWKIRQKGYSLGHADGAVVFHRSRTSLSSLIKQHIGYGAGTTYHCIRTNRPPSELGIPEPTYTACFKEIFSYITQEVPKRFINCYRDNLGIKKSIAYPLLDLVRKTSYVYGILKARPLISSKIDHE